MSVIPSCCTARCTCVSRVLSTLPPAFAGVPIVRAAVGVEGTEQPLRLNDLLQTLEAAHGPFFLDEEGRVELVRRIIQRHDQIPLTVRNPFMGGAILMEHHAGQRVAGPLLAMGAAPGSPRHVSGLLQPVLRPRVGAGPPILRVPVLVEMLHRPARVAGLIQPHHLLDFVHRDCTS